MSSAEEQPAGRKHLRGACWSAWYYDRENFGTHAERLATTAQCCEWIGKLNELGAEPALIETVIERLEELR